MTNLVTFTSDFGYTDSYVAEVKGVIIACSVDAIIIDITHGIDPQNITAGSFVLFNSYRYFPRGTLHLAVVDPGVGTPRDILIIKTEGYTFIGPDNGILYEAARSDGIAKLYSLDRPLFVQSLEKIFRGNDVIKTVVKKGISTTFHGRDLFAPLVGYLLRGFSLDEITQEKSSMIEREIPKSVEHNNALWGEIISIDRFGNLITNIQADEVSWKHKVFLKTAKRMVCIGTLKSSYAQVPEGTCLPIIGSRGYLEIAVNRGNAHHALGAQYGDIIYLKEQES